MTQAEVTPRACDGGIAAGRDCRTGDECKKRAPESYIRPTPQERQSAAEEMRRDPGFPEEVTFRSEDGEFFQRNAFYMGSRVVSLFPKAETWRDVQLALADLIDPTCHIEPVYMGESDGRASDVPKGQPVFFYVCSACRRVLYRRPNADYEKDVDGEWHVTWFHGIERYCPSCGRRIEWPEYEEDE